MQLWRSTGLRIWRRATTATFSPPKVYSTLALHLQFMSCSTVGRGRWRMRQMCGLCRRFRLSQLVRSAPSQPLPRPPRPSPGLEAGDFSEVEIAHFHGGDYHVEGLFAGGAH